MCCGLAAGAWLGGAEAPTKLVVAGVSPFFISLSMVAGVFVARLFGTALIALGLAWWFARNQPREPWARGCCLGFLVYNVGAGLWLMLRAPTVSQRVPLLWTLGLFHAGLGLAFAALLLRRSPASLAK